MSALVTGANGFVGGPANRRGCRGPSPLSRDR